ncbi:hypothetical protein GCM10027053_25160 [Intrasporangium mesophilum]
MRTRSLTRDPGGRRRLAGSLAVVSATLALAGCGGNEVPESTGGTAQAGGWAAIEAAAKKEGAVVYYSTDSSTLNNAVVKAFNQKYPDIKVQVLQGSGDLAARVSTEQESGIHAQDVLASGFQDLQSNKDWFLKLDPSVMPVLASEKWPSAMKSDTWVANKQQFLVVTWNTDKVNGDDLKTWSDVLKPEFKDQVAMIDVRGSDTMFSWVDAVASTLGDDFVRKVAAQNPQMVNGGTPTAQEVASGAHSIGFPQSGMLITDLSNKGAPIAFKVLTDPVVQSIGFLSVFKNAPHPNAALVFANFRESPEGMAAMCSAVGPPGQTGVKAPFDRPIPQCQAAPAGKIVQGRKLVATDPDYARLLGLLGMKPQSN